VDHAIELIMQYGDHGVDPTLRLRELESVTGLTWPSSPPTSGSNHAWGWLDRATVAQLG
jgi:hypothetical protein